MPAKVRTWEGRISDERSRLLRRFTARAPRSTKLSVLIALDTYANAGLLDTDHAASVTELLGLRGPAFTLGGACAHYQARCDAPIDFDQYFSRNIYHSPFGGMTFLAHKSMMSATLDLAPREVRAHSAPTARAPLSVCSPCWPTMRR